MKGVIGFELWRIDLGDADISVANQIVVDDP